MSYTQPVPRLVRCYEVQVDPGALGVRGVVLRRVKVHFPVLRVVHVGENTQRTVEGSGSVSFAVLPSPKPG